MVQVAPILIRFGKVNTVRNEISNRKNQHPAPNWNAWIVSNSLLRRNFHNQICHLFFIHPEKRVKPFLGVTVKGENELRDDQKLDDE